MEVPVRIPPQPIFIDGKRVNSIKVENSQNGNIFLVAITYDMQIYFSWKAVPITWEKATYSKESL